MKSGPIQKYRSMPVEVKASLWYTICNVLQKSVSLITVPIFTRLLTTEDYGLTNVFNTWMSLAVIFATLNLQAGSFNTAMVKFEGRRDQYISCAQSLVTLNTLVLLVVYLLVQDQVNRITGLDTPLIVAMAVQMVCSFAYGIWTGKKRFDYQYRSVVAMTLVGAVLVPAVGVAAVLSVPGGRGEVKIISAALVELVLYGALYVCNIARGKCIFDKGFWGYALGMNVVLIPYYLSQMAFNSSDLLMIDWICGRADAGLYGVAYQFAVVLTFVLNAINNSFVPWKYRKFKACELSRVPAVTNGVGMIVAAMMVLLMLAGPEIMWLFAAPQYYEARWVIPPVAASMFFLFLTQVFVDVEFYFEDKLMLVCGSILAAVANIALNAQLLPLFGYVAAGYTTLASYMLFAGANALCARRTLKKRGGRIRLRDICDARVLASIAAGMIVFTLACVGLYQLSVARYVVLGMSLIVAFLLREKIGDVLLSTHSESRDSR